MDVFQCDDPISGQSVQVTLHAPFVAQNLGDDYQEVSLLFADGRRYLTAFWRRPHAENGHWIEEPGMVIVHDLTPELILAAVKDIVREGSVELAFEPTD